MAQITGAHLGTTHSGLAQRDLHLETCLDVILYWDLMCRIHQGFWDGKAECQYWEVVGLFKGMAYCELAKATDLRRDQGCSSRSNPLLLPHACVPHVILSVMMWRPRS